MRREARQGHEDAQYQAQDDHDEREYDGEHESAQQRTEESWASVGSNSVIAGAFHWNGGSRAGRGSAALGWNGRGLRWSRG